MPTCRAKTVRRDLCRRRIDRSDLLDRCLGGLAARAAAMPPATVAAAAAATPSPAATAVPDPPALRGRRERRRRHRRWACPGAAGFTEPRQAPVAWPSDTTKFFEPEQVGLGAVPNHVQLVAELLHSSAPPPLVPPRGGAGAHFGPPGPSPSAGSLPDRRPAAGRRAAGKGGLRPSWIALISAWTRSILAHFGAAGGGASPERARSWLTVSRAISLSFALPGTSSCVANRVVHPEAGGRGATRRIRLLIPYSRQTGANHASRAPARGPGQGRRWPPAGPCPSSTTCPATADACSANQFGLVAGAGLRLSEEPQRGPGKDPCGFWSRCLDGRAVTMVALTQTFVHATSGARQWGLCRRATSPSPRPHRRQV